MTPKTKQLWWDETHCETLLNIIDERKDELQHCPTRDEAWELITRELQSRHPELQSFENLGRKIERKLRYFHDRKGGVGSFPQNVFQNGSSAFSKLQLRGFRKSKSQASSKYPRASRQSIESSAVNGSARVLRPSDRPSSDYEDPSPAKRSSHDRKDLCARGGTLRRANISHLEDDASHETIIASSSLSDVANHSGILPKDCLARESHDLEQWARRQLSQDNPMPNMDELRDRMENLKECIEQALILFLQGMGIDPEQLANLEFDSGSNTDIRDLTALVFDTKLSRASLLRPAKTGCLHLTDILRAYIAGAIYHWIFTASFVEEFNIRNTQDKHMLDQLDQITHSTYKALELDAQQRHITEVIGPQIESRAKGFADRMNSVVTSLVYAIGRRCRPSVAGGPPKSYKDASWIDDWEKQLHSIFVDALRLTIDLRNCALLQEKSHSFRWPHHDSVYDPTWIQHDSQSRDSCRILLTLFPALYRQQDSGDLLVSCALAVTYRI